MAGSCLGSLRIARNVPAGAPGHAPLNERQGWVLGELKRKAKLQCAMFPGRFSVSAKTAKRDLSQLTGGGRIEYFREGRGGHYRLRGR